MTFTFSLCGPELPQAGGPPQAAFPTVTSVLGCSCRPPSGVMGPCPLPRADHSLACALVGGIAMSPAGDSYVWFHNQHCHRKKIETMQLGPGSVSCHWGGSWDVLRTRGAGVTVHRPREHREEAPGLQSHLAFAGGGKVQVQGQEPEGSPAGHPQPCPGRLVWAVRERLETGPDAGRLLSA